MNSLWFGGGLGGQAVKKWSCVAVSDAAVGVAAAARGVSGRAGAPAYSYT